MADRRSFALIMVVMLAAAGCSSSGNRGSIQSYPFMNVEPKWIQNGEPIFYDGKRWYPQDDVEIFQDSEVSLIGDYRGVQVFIDKTDVKPYSRLFTKFAVNKYRYYYPIPKEGQ